MNTLHRYILDDENWCVRPIPDRQEITLNDLMLMHVEYTKSLDNKIQIEYCTSDGVFDCDEYGYHKDIEIDNETYARYLAIMEY